MLRDSPMHSEYRVVPDTARARQVAGKSGVAPDADLSFDSSIGAFRTTGWRGQLVIEKNTADEVKLLPKRHVRRQIANYLICQLWLELMAADGGKQGIFRTVFCPRVDSG
jgi:hypothetical protein